MKYLKLLFFILLYSLKSFSQTKGDANYAYDKVGQTVTIIDYASDVHSEKGVTTLYMGNDPKKQIRVVFTSSDSLNLGWITSKDVMGSQLLVTGKVLRNKGVPTIIVSRSTQVQKLTYNDMKPLSSGSKRVILKEKQDGFSKKVD